MNENGATNQNKKYIIITILFLIIVFGVTFFTRFFLQKINEVSIETQKLIADQENNIKMLAQLPGTRDQFNEIEPHISVLDEFFQEDQIVSLVKLLEKMATETRNEISIEVFEDNKVKSRSEKKTAESLIVFPEEQIVRIGVNLSGRYDSMVEFIQRLKGIKYYNDIESIDVAVKKTQATSVPVRPSTIFKEAKEGEENKVVEEVQAEEKNVIDTELIMVFYLENKKNISK